MSPFTQGSWTKSAQKIEGSFYMLRLLACDVGADQSGADLLFALAKVVNRPVIGPTYLVYCGNGKVTLDPQARWQQATPTMKPAPIPKPRVKVQAEFTYKFEIDGKMTPVPSKNLHVLKFEYAPGQPGAAFSPMNAGSATELMRWVDFSHPFEPGGTPLAMVTGTFQLQLSSGEKTINKQFALYNDEIVQDLDEKAVFYRVDSRLGDRLQSLRLSASQK